MTTIAHIQALQQSQPQLPADKREEYERICARIHRADSEVRRFKKRGDAAQLVAAARRLTRAREARDAFVDPFVKHLWCPVLIVAKFEERWSGPSGSGPHLHECEMVLDYRDLSGPEYRTVRVLKDENGPPTNARSAPHTMGVAWFALTDQIKRGKIVVIMEKP